MRHLVFSVSPSIKDEVEMITTATLTENKIDLSKLSLKS